MKKFIILTTNVTLALVFLLGVFWGQAGAKVPKKKTLRASADIFSCAGDDSILGTAVLKEKKSTEGIKQVAIKMIVKGLSEGQHAVHIHETAACEISCGATQGHFDPGPNSNTNPDGNHPFHMGDLVNIEVNRGVGVMRTRTNRITLSPGPLSIFDNDGSAFIIHVNPDTYCPNGPEAGCAGGARAACGNIYLD